MRMKLEPWTACLEQALERVPTRRWPILDVLRGYYENESEGLERETTAQEIRSGAIQSMICNLGDMSKDDAVIDLCILINTLTNELYGSETSKTNL